MSGPAESVLERVRRDGSGADLSEPVQAVVLTPSETVELLGHAGAAFDAAPDASLELWDQAGRLRGLDELDQVLAGLRPGGFLAGLTGKRRKLRESARAALRGSVSAGTVRLAAAVVGAFGGEEDIGPLEALAVHPDLTLHAVTALSYLGFGSRAAVFALLRVMHDTSGAERLIVIDRLLQFVDEPAVRFALVRDGLVGVGPDHAREVADAIDEYCNVDGVLTDKDADSALRAGAEQVKRLRSPSPPPAD